MGRPHKPGLGYFPLDVDFFNDEKIEFVSAKFGLSGEAITIRLLTKIYREGYFINWDDDVLLLFSSKLKAGENDLQKLVTEVLSELLKRNFFDLGMYQKYGILTSRGIQRRFRQVCEGAKRKNSLINPEFCLLDEVIKLTTGVSSGETGVSSGKTPSNQRFTPEETGLTPEFSTQTKLNKTKENKIKENHNKQREFPPEETQKFCDDDGAFVFESDEVLEQQFIRPLFKQFLENLNPNSHEISGVKNAIFKDENLSPEVAAKLVYEAFEVIAITKPENRNTRYLFGIIKKKKQDYLTNLREQAAKVKKQIENRAPEKLPPGSIRNEFLNLTGQQHCEPVSLSEILKTPVTDDTVLELPTQL